MLTFQVSKEPVAYTKNLSEVEIVGKRKEQVYIPAQFKIEHEGKTYVLYGKDAKGADAIKGMNGVLATCEKVKNDILADPKMDDKTRQTLVKNITAYEKDVITRVKEYTLNSEFTSGVEMQGPKDIFMRLGGKGMEKDVTAKAFGMIEKYPALKPLEKFSYYGAGGNGSPYLTSLTHGDANPPSKHLETREYKPSQASKSGTEYGKTSNYDLDGVSVQYTPAVITKK